MLCACLARAGGEVHIMGVHGVIPSEQLMEGVEV